MSRNTSRKYKRYKRMKENEKLFGDILAKNEYGYTDLVPMSASKGEIVIKKQKYSGSTGNVGAF